MSLLMIIFLFSTTEAKPLGDIDSLEVEETVETTSEEVDPVLQYTFGMDTYSTGFNKGSISTNTLEEQINTTNGNLELKIKLLSLPMRGNKDYDLYLTYRGSPLSIPGMQLRPYRPYKTYGHNVPPEDVEDSLLEGLRNKYIVSSDMGNCGLGWNVMPGEVSRNPYWQEHYISGDSCFSKRRDGFIHLNGGKKYSIYNIEQMWTDDWFISGKRNWNLNINFQPILSTPEYTHEFSDYPVLYPNPRNIPGGYDNQRALYTLTKITDRNGNYINIEWSSSDDPPEARIPHKICTPTDTCYIYGDPITVDTADYCLWDFWVIDSIVRNVNGEKFKVNFYYHQEWFNMIMEYWYGHAFVLLDSVEFLKNGSRIKPPYRFEYDTRYNNSDPERRQGELITLITPDNAKYEYWYAQKGSSHCKYGQSACSDPYLTKYRVVNEKVVTLPDTAHIESGDGSNPDGVLEYLYAFGESVGPSSGHWWDRGGQYGWVCSPLTYYPIYDKCTINMPDTGIITYFNVDSTYVENLLDIEWRRFCSFVPECVPMPEMIRPFEREEFYGRPYKIMTYNNSDDELKLEQFYWTISDEVLPGGGSCEDFFEWPLHPFLRYKAVQLDPNNDYIEIGEKAKVYHYPEYDKYDNKKTVRFLGEAELTGDSSYYIIIGGGYYRQEWLISGMPKWDDVDPSDNWEVRNSYLYEQDSTYADAFLYNLVDSTFKKDYNENLVRQAAYEYDVNSLSGAGSAPMHGSSPYNKRGNLTKKTEWINSSDTRSQEYWYDICGNLDTLKDYMGEKYQFEYGSEYVFPDTVTSPDGLKTDFDFDKKGNLTSVTDKSGIVDSFQYDIYGRITESWKGIPGNMDLLGIYQYNDSRRRSREISFNSDAPGDYDAIVYSYDGLGRLINEERNPPNSVVVDYIYNGNGQVSKETQPRFDNISLYDADYTIKTFDGLGRTTEIEYPKSSYESGAEFVTYEYNKNITDVRDEKGYYTTLIKDASGNLVEVIDALDDTTRYEYDVNGNLLKVIDAEGKEIDFEYDWLGNLVRREGPDRGVDIFEYDANCNTIYHNLNSGDVIRFEYDQLDRIERKRVNGVEEEIYYYDDYTLGGLSLRAPPGLHYPEGRITGFRNTKVGEVYFYDEFGNLRKKLVIPLPVLHLPPDDVDTFNYSYDLKGRLTKLEYPNSYYVEYEYDKLGNISAVEINDEKTVNMSSTAAGLLSGIHFPGEVTDTFTYKPRNWMDSMNISGISTPYNRLFEYNRRGELRREWKGDDCITHYDYDALGRIILDSRYQEGSYYHNYVYDKVGNRIKMDYGSIEYDYEPGTNKLIDDDESEYTYDENGCISSKTDVNGTTNFTYDSEGRLAGLCDKDGNGYKYYYKGYQRIREEKLSGIEVEGEGYEYSCEVKYNNLTGGILEAVFLNANNNEIGDSILYTISGSHPNDWEDLSGNISKDDLPTGTASLKLRVRRESGSGTLLVGDMSIDIEEGQADQAYNYFYDNAGNLIIVDDDNESNPPIRYIYAGNRLLATENDGELYFYHLDRIGSPIMITDEDGEVVKEKKYEAFGNLKWSSGTYSDNREFTSKEKDPTGFHYFGARYYSGDIGRFLSPDPISIHPFLLDLGHPQTLNPYVYCHNDPVNYLDPLGLDEVDFDRPDIWMEGGGTTVTAPRDHFDAYNWGSDYKFFNSQGPNRSGVRENFKMWVDYMVDLIRDKLTGNVVPSDPKNVEGIRDKYKPSHRVKKVHKELGELEETDSMYNDPEWLNTTNLDKMIEGTRDSTIPDTVYPY